MLIPSIGYGAVFGVIGGLIWSLALNTTITTGLIFGGMAGVVVGFVISVIGEAAASRGRISRPESASISGSYLTTIAMICAGLGLLTWLARVLFW